MLLEHGMIDQLVKLAASFGGRAPWGASLIVAPQTPFGVYSAGGGKQTIYVFFFPLTPLFSTGHPDYGVQRPPIFLVRLGRPPAFGEKHLFFDYSAAIGQPAADPMPP